jgi:hypothetical protein
MTARDRRRAQDDGSGSGNESASVIRGTFNVLYGTIAVLFLCCGAAVIVFAAIELVRGINPASDTPLYPRFTSILEAIGLLAVAVVSVELGQTVLEEEIRREANISAPTRVRRFLSRFLVLIVIALAF